MSQNPDFSFVEKTQYFLLRSAGRTLVALPEFVARGICAAIGDLIYFCGGKRKQTLLRNLHHSYPELSEKERRRIGRRSSRQSVELGLLGLALPWISEQWILKRFTINEGCRKAFEIDLANPQPRVILIPHFSLTEGICFSPTYLRNVHPNVGVVYRPFKSRPLEKIIKDGRERWGLFLLSRKEGFVQASRILREKGMIAILFDQNAGHQGSLTPFFGRVASSTELPSLLAQKHGADVFYVWLKRSDFWKGELHTVPSASKEMEPAARTLEAQSWLEKVLQAPDTDKASWLWLHNRWRTQDEWQYRFQIRAKKVIALPDPQQDPERATRFWIRTPNWLGDIVMTLPLLRALERGRPDVRWTLFAPAMTCELLSRMFPRFDIQPLPKKGWKRFKWFRDLRLQYPDLFLQFTQSTRSDLEARLTKAKNRYGLAFPGKKRRWLTHTFNSPYPRNPQDIHQFQVWSEFLSYFGLKETPDLTPFRGLLSNSETSTTPLSIGLICGTENSPEKRWPAESFAQLIQQLAKQFPEARFHLYGTAKDREITTQVATLSGLADDKVLNQAGQTTLIEFAQMLSDTTLLIGNDTGGIHLANALGVPVVVLFGPTNPLRTAPIFEAPRKIIQPPNCPAHGGGKMTDIRPEYVAEITAALLK